MRDEAREEIERDYKKKNCYLSNPTYNLVEKVYKKKKRTL